MEQSGPAGRGSKSSSAGGPRGFFICCCRYLLPKEGFEIGFARRKNSSRADAGSSVENQQGEEEGSEGRASIVFRTRHVAGLEKAAAEIFGAAPNEGFR